MPAMRHARFVPAFVIAAVVVLAAPAFAANQWPNYGGSNHTSNDTSAPSLNPLHTAWTKNLDQKVYGQPLVFDGRVYAATENDTVYALDAHDGGILWSRHVGTPMTNVSAQTGCGNVDPLGILSTPVIDTASNTIYVVATIEDSFNHIHHQLIGLNALTGAPKVSANADPPDVAPLSQNPKQIQQRTGLLLANGRIYIGFGGYAGDCGDYHGWMVSLSEAGTSKVSFDVTPGEHNGLGAIWAPGGPGVDGSGNVYIATGNPDPSGGDHGESVLKFDNSSAMHLSGSFATFPGGDNDIASVSPAMLGNNLLFQIGKQHLGMLVDTSTMTQLHSLAMCNGVDADGATAWDGSHLYVPCNDGIQQVNINTSTKTMSLGWKGPSENSAGSPTIADGIVWSVQWTSGTLFALDPSNGHTLFTMSVGGAVPHFASVASALGLLLVGTNSGVTAFAGPGGVPPHAPSACVAQTGHTSYWVASSDGNVIPLGDAPSCGSLSGTPLNKPIVGIAGTRARGYWLGASDGGVFTFGPDAHYYGGMGGKPLNKPIVGIAAAPTANGYYLVASDGGIFNFGPGSHFHGSTGGVRLNKPIVGMAVAPDGNGYYLVASDGGVFTFGPSAHFHGSMGGKHLNKPIVGMALTVDGRGYWLVASDGGIFTFGDAAYHGSTGGMTLNKPIVGMATTGGGGGYWLVASDGGVFSFHAPFRGSATGFTSAAPAVGMAHD
jgi:outer membrane protein assembly factor BamB